MKRELLHQLSQNIDNLLLLEQVMLKGRLKRIRQRIKDKQPVDKMLEKAAQFKERAEEKAKALKNLNFRVDYPKNLPVSQRVDDIKQALSDNQVVIVCGTTGSGKTTQLPKILVDAGYGTKGRIGCTQPRRLAAVSMGRRVAEELGTQYGHGVGCKVRFDDQTCDHTAVKFMTDGILLSETISDKQLLQYDAIIIDEAHERSLNIDFLLGYLKNLRERRPDLKIVISSATLDADSFSEFFDGAPIISVEGRTYPVEDFFLPPNEDEDLSQTIFRAVRWISDVDREGDILVFLPGEREIREALSFLEDKRIPKTEVLPLFGRLSIGDQQRVFKVGGRRRIVLATNVAETSITIPGIHYVIDSGLVRISRYNPRTQIQSLLVEQVSKASAMQRRGRCGRVAEGVCVYLYDEETLEKAVDYTDPEIKRTSLAGVILQMSTLGLPQISEFPLIDPPQDALVREGYRVLKEIGALDDSMNLTKEGREIASFPVDPHLAKVICQGNREGALYEILIIIAFLSLQDPRERPFEKKQAADQAHRQWHDEKSDFSAILHLWNFIETERKNATSNSALRRLCKKNFLNFMRIREWGNLVNDLRNVIKDHKWRLNNKDRVVEDFHYDLVHRSLLAGIPYNIGMLDEEKTYIGARNRKFTIFPGSCLIKETPKWIMMFSLVHTSRLFARMVAEIDPAWIEDLVPELCKRSYKDVAWGKQRGFVSAREVVTLGGLIINGGRSVHYGGIDPVEARRMFIEEAMVPGNIVTRGKWLQLHRKMIKSIRKLEVKIRRPDALLDYDAIKEHFNTVLPDDIFSTKSLEAWIKKERARIAMRMNDAMIEQVTPVKPEEYPDTIEFLGHPFSLRYRFEPGEADDGMCLMCPTDDLGMLPDWSCDWLVPGWLTEKVTLLIKSLPKRVRIQCNPVAQTAAEFLNLVESEEISQEQHLVDALATFIGHKLSADITHSDFDEERLPSFLTMKVAEVDDNNRILNITAGLPDRERMSSQVSSAVSTIKSWIVVGKKTWPGADLPKKIDLDSNSGMVGYPALVDEGESVGQQVYMDKREAEFNHRNGVIRLFRLEWNDVISFVFKKLPLNKDTELSLALLDGSLRWRNDFIDSCIWEALTDRGRFDLRSAKEFQERCEAAREELYSVSEVFGKKIRDLISVYDDVKVALESFRVPRESEVDINHQLNFLFRDGFMLDGKVYSAYARYMKALKIRLERMEHAPDKDLSKFERVQPYMSIFVDKYREAGSFDNAFSLLEFGYMVEEFRISQFAPEVSTPVKISTKRLDKFLDEVLKFT